MTSQPQGFEYKHVEVPQNPSVVDHVTNTHAMFWWEMTATQTIVAKEAHLESGTINSDNLYSVITTERFTTIDFRRPTDTPDLQRVRSAEKQYFDCCALLVELGCSPLDNYTNVPAEPFNFFEFMGLTSSKIRLPHLGYWNAFLEGLPVFGYLRKSERRYKERTDRHLEIRPALDRLIEDNGDVLNTAVNIG